MLSEERRAALVIEDVVTLAWDEYNRAWDLNALLQQTSISDGVGVDTSAISVSEWTNILSNGAVSSDVDGADAGFLQTKKKILNIMSGHDTIAQGLHLPHEAARSDDAGVLAVGVFVHAFFIRCALHDQSDNLAHEVEVLFLTEHDIVSLCVLKLVLLSRELVIADPT